MNKQNTRVTLPRSPKLDQGSIGLQEHTYVDVCYIHGVRPKKIIEMCAEENLFDHVFLFVEDNTKDVLLLKHGSEMPTDFYFVRGKKIIVDNHLRQMYPSYQLDHVSSNRTWLLERVAQIKTPSLPSMSLDQMIEEFRRLIVGLDLKQRDMDILTARLLRGETLEMIGAQHGITRERIRQIVAKNDSLVRNQIILKNIACFRWYERKVEEFYKNLLSFKEVKETFAVKEENIHVLKYLTQSLFEKCMFIQEFELGDGFVTLPLDIKLKDFGFDKTIKNLIDVCVFKNEDQSIRSMKKHLSSSPFSSGLRSFLINYTLGGLRKNGDLLVSEKKNSSAPVKSLISDFLQIQNSPVHLNEVYKLITQFIDNIDIRNIPRFIDEMNDKNTNPEERIHHIVGEGYIFWKRLELDEELTVKTSQFVSIVVRAKPSYQFSSKMLYKKCCAILPDLAKQAYGYQILSPILRQYPPEGVVDLGRGTWVSQKGSTKRVNIADLAYEILERNEGSMPYRQLILEIKKRRDYNSTAPLMHKIKTKWENGKRVAYIEKRCSTDLPVSEKE